ncbi:MAG: hypothetical protein NT027_01250, partial [Proteobacteria bacterium]|nr:hypothetical protein [Pseudomonadota bacterium]
LTPEERPIKFMVGGHRLNLKKLGIDGETINDTYTYNPEYKAWSSPEVYDTTDRGRGNKGHEAEFADLSNQDKWALIEYLKLL